MRDIFWVKPSSTVFRHVFVRNSYKMPFEFPMVDERQRGIFGLKEKLLVSVQVLLTGERGDYDIQDNTAN